MGGLPDPEWYFDNVLINAEPGGATIAVPGPAQQWQRWWHAQGTADVVLDALLRRQGFVVTTAQLRDAGWAPHDLRREVRRGRWWVPARGTASPVVSPGDDFASRRQRHAVAAAAAALLRADHVASGVSATVLHGLPTLSVPRVPQLTAYSPDWLGRRPKTHLRHSAVFDDETTWWFGVPLTTVARTIVDLGRHDRRTALMAADAALRERLVTVAGLDAALERAWGWPGVRQAREIVALADGDAESALESVVRLALHDDGFPKPRLQQLVSGYRVDFLWPEYRLVLEADGRVKYTDDALWREKVRQIHVHRAGYDVERVTWPDVMDDWPATSRYLWTFFRR